MKESWDDCGVFIQAKLIAFDQTSSYDESEREAQLAGARMPSGMGGPPAAPSKKSGKGKRR